MVNNIAILKEELHYKMFGFIRNVVGCISGQTNSQVYMKFKSALMELHISLRSKESLWPIVFLDISMLDSINWLAHLRL